MSLPLRWEFPGGKVEDGERPEVALVRELHEEFGVDVAVYEHIGEGTSEVDGRRIWLEVYRTDVTSGSLTLHEHEAVRWVGAEELDELDWAEADLPVIPAVKRLLEK